MDQFVAEWNTWRDSRNSALATPFGWLSVSGLHWLDEESTWPGAPGTFTVENGWASVALEPGTKAGPAAASFDLLNAEPTEDGAESAPTANQVRIEERGFNAKLIEGGALEWFTVGPKLYELIERGGRLGIRVRDSKSPLLHKFIEVPVFEPDRSYVYLGKFTRFDEPETRAISTAQDDLTLSTELVGIVSFETTSGEVELFATGNPESGLHLNFYDETNGRTTSAWRTLDLGIPNHDGSLVIDFNRAVNFPFAFSAFATCPAPVEENIIPFPVRAGEQRPPFYLSKSGINTPFLFYKFWEQESPDQSARWYSQFGLDTRVLNPLQDNDDPSLVGYDGVAMSGGDLSLLGRKARSRLIKVVTEALTSRIPVIGMGAYAEMVITAQREQRAQLGYDDGIEQEYRATPGTVLMVFNNELQPSKVGLKVVHTDASGLIYVEVPVQIPLESQFQDEDDYAAAVRAGDEVGSWQEFVYRLARLVREHR